MGVLSKPNPHIAMEPKRVQISFPKAQDHIRWIRQVGSVGSAQATSKRRATILFAQYIQRNIDCKSAHADTSHHTA